MRDSPEQAQIERWVRTWREAGPALEAQKLAELRRLDTARALAELGAAFEHARLTAQTADTSGLVEQQRYFRRLHE
jgi:hypothetical protein